MITRPLDLNSRLRPPPRSFDWVHYVNLVIIAMFFIFFGSRFILSPAIVVESKDFQLPSRPAEKVTYMPGTTVISIKSNGQIFTDTGLVNHAQLQSWLTEKIKDSPDASLLMRADASVTIDEITRIYELVREAGFKSDRISIPVAPDKTDATRHPAGIPTDQ